MNLNDIRNIKDNWNGYGAVAPNEVAFKLANLVAEAIDKQDVLIQPSVEAGIGLTYKNGRYGVFIECYNDGDIAFALTVNGYPTSSHDLRAEGIEQLAFVAAVRKHLAAA